MHQINDPQLAAALATYEEMVPDGVDFDVLPRTRKFFSYLMSLVNEAVPAVPGILSKDHLAPGPTGGPDVKVRIYQPEKRPETLPALLWIHGGGYVLGDIDQDDALARNLALSLNCVVASVEYRLAPEHPFPAPLEDCYTALKWLAGNSDILEINPKRIAIGGASAGGGLAAGLGLLVRDRAEIDLCFQLLIYPMLDDSNVGQAGPEHPDTPVWSRANNLAGWSLYLQKAPGSEGISPYAAAIRAEDVSGLPPTFIGVGSPDLFRDENIAYARRLMDAGVPTELHICADGYHGFDMLAPDSEAARRFTTVYTDILKQVLHPTNHQNITMENTMTTHTASHFMEQGFS